MAPTMNRLAYFGVLLIAVLGAQTGCSTSTSTSEPRHSGSGPCEGDSKGGLTCYYVEGCPYSCCDADSGVLGTCRTLYQYECAVKTATSCAADAGHD